MQGKCGQLRPDPGIPHDQGNPARKGPADLRQRDAREARPEFDPGTDCNPPLVGETMPRTKKPELRFPIRLTLAQRKDFAEVIPRSGRPPQAGRTKPAEHRPSLAELKAIKAKAETAIQKATQGVNADRFGSSMRGPTRPLPNVSDSRLQSRSTSSRSPCSEPSLRSGDESRSRTARSTSCTNTSRRQWAGRTAICTSFRSASSFTATPN